MNDRNPFGQKNDGGSCECSECGRRFGGLTGFDAHRVTLDDPDGYDWRCTTDAELTARGLAQEKRGVWRWSAQDARFDRNVRTETAA